MGAHQDQQGRKKGGRSGDDGKGVGTPPCPPPPLPPRHPLTVQKIALIAAVLYDWLIIESVIISRSKNVQVILGGDFGKLKFPPYLFNDEATLAEGIGLLEALEDTSLFSGEGEEPVLAAEEAFAVTQHAESEENRGRGKRRRKLNKSLPRRNTSKKKRM